MKKVYYPYVKSKTEIRVNKLQDHLDSLGDALISFSKKEFHLNTGDRTGLEVPKIKKRPTISHQKHDLGVWNVDPKRFRRKKIDFEDDPYKIKALKTKIKKHSELNKNLGVSDKDLKPVPNDLYYQYNLKGTTAEDIRDGIWTEDVKKNYDEWDYGTERILSLSEILDMYKERQSLLHRGPGLSPWERDSPRAGLGPDRALVRSNSSGTPESDRSPRAGLGPDRALVRSNSSGTPESDRSNSSGTPESDRSSFNLSGTIRPQRISVVGVSSYVPPLDSLSNDEEQDLSTPPNISKVSSRYSTGSPKKRSILSQSTHGQKTPSQERTLREIREEMANRMDEEMERLREAFELARIAKGEEPEEKKEHEAERMDPRALHRLITLQTGDLDASIANLPENAGEDRRYNIYEQGKQLARNIKSYLDDDKAKFDKSIRDAVLTAYKAKKALILDFDLQLTKKRVKIGKQFQRKTAKVVIQLILDELGAAEPPVDTLAPAKDEGEGGDY
jgi:hypothetical protein